MFQPKPLSGADNLKLYLSEAVLPPVTHATSAPFMPPKGHKAHRNHIAVQPEAYRQHFTKILALRRQGLFDKEVKIFLETFPCAPLNLPNVDTETGFAFTVPAPGFNVQQTPLPRPSNVQELAPWVTALPLQTMTRALHMALPETRGWDVTYANDSEDPDSALWHTLLWRKTPEAPGPDTYEVSDPLERCSVLFAVQPPWILSEQDIKSFMNCKGLPPYSAWGEENNRPYTSAERIWGKLWENCVRRDCHHWVISTYWGWVFGAFTEGFTAGQIIDLKRYDAKTPTILECLVYHVASSMGLVAGFKLPQFFETRDELEWNRCIPKPSRDLYVECPDSGSEWDGMEDDPGLSAGVSQQCDVTMSSWDSEDGSEDGSEPGSDTTEAVRTAHLKLWKQRYCVNVPPPPDRPMSRSPSPSTVIAESLADVYKAAVLPAPLCDRIPEVRVVTAGDMHRLGGYLTTVVEQGPSEE